MPFEPTSTDSKVVVIVLTVFLASLISSILGFAINQLKQNGGIISIWELVGIVLLSTWIGYWIAKEIKQNFNKRSK